MNSGGILMVRDGPLAPCVEQPGHLRVVGYTYRVPFAS